MKARVAVFFAFLALSLADLYLHNPRGSNDRLNEANTNRNNGNRLFDSQNNAKGGYCWGPEMTFYERSLLSVEWTTQHGCGANPKLVCNIVIQYMCTANDADLLTRVRDGATTNTIPDDLNAAQQLEADGVTPTYGMHESYQYYQDCKTRDRNMGLFIADREAVGGLTTGRRSAIYTRQNNNGNRNGYECAEERDYYPYWHPSPWKDIAILSHDPNWCEFYQAESQNVKAKNYCEDPANPGVQAQPNNEVECKQEGLVWREQAAHGIPAPECVQAPWSRENHLGNGMQTGGGFANSFNATMPDKSYEPCIEAGNCACALRIRYNISTVEDTMPDMSRPDTGFVDWSANAGASPVNQNPIVTPSGMELELALDTSQFGRTFQDRTHVFKIAARPQGVSKLGRIFNLNVRGKRGNIVQAYPSTEYDFVPQILYARVGDYIHFQWTGCDTNPAGNAGEGKDGTDRSNMVQLPREDASYPITDTWAGSNPKKLLFKDPNVRLRFAQLDQVDCLTRDELLAANGNNANAAEQDLRNCGKLNAASPYFDGGVHKLNNTGSFHYMSTRNHNFSNRDQKGALIVQPLLPTWALGIVIAGAALFVAAAGVAFMMFYAKNNPHSGVANIFSKM
jgi:hypothetical protein